ncbi:MAG: hypothetical protein WC450_02700 [Candidatus Omnitrophota bacterium]|jgi:hypothetical protein
MKRLAKQFVLYLATVVIMMMTLIAIAVWHLFKWGYPLTRFLKTGRNSVDISCRKTNPPAEPEHNVSQKEELESPMVSVSEKG